VVEGFGHLVADKAGAGGAEFFEYLYQVSGIQTAGRKGLGLGLHIAKELVTARQGGAIWATSAPGSASVFSFTGLPIYVGPKPNEAVPVRKCLDGEEIGL